MRRLWIKKGRHSKVLPWSLRLQGKMGVLLASYIFGEDVYD